MKTWFYCCKCRAPGITRHCEYCDHDKRIRRDEMVTRCKVCGVEFNPALSGSLGNCSSCGLADAMANKLLPLSGIPPIKATGHIITREISIHETLDERGKNYGDYRIQGAYSKRLKNIFSEGSSWDKLHEYQQDALEMIATKISRILNGDPSYADSWRDIAGFATLVEKELEKKNG